MCALNNCFSFLLENLEFSHSMSIENLCLENFITIKNTNVATIINTVMDAYGKLIVNIEIGAAVLLRNTQMGKAVEEMRE